MSKVHDLWTALCNHQSHWMPRAKWDALAAGTNCPLCADVDQQENKFSFLVARLKTSNLRLSKNQYVRGYCVLAYREHAVELHQLAPEKHAAFMQDLVHAGSAVARVFNPIKMNYQLLGNLVPHLHWHIIPRYWGDPAPGRPMDPNSHIIQLKQTEYEHMVAELRTALGVMG